MNNNKDLDFGFEKPIERSKTTTCKSHIFCNYALQMTGHKTYLSARALVTEKHDSVRLENKKYMTFQDEQSKPKLFITFVSPFLIDCL
jgi:hypothetical protein